MIQFVSSNGIDSLRQNNKAFNLFFTQQRLLKVSPITDEPPLFLTKTMLEGMEAEFLWRYTVSDKANFTAPIIIEWELFKSFAVDQFTNIDASKLVLKFIHRYDSATNRWFLTVRICTLQQDPNGPGIYDLDEYINMFSIGEISGSVTDAKGTDVPKDRDADYFNNINYSKVAGESPTPLTKAHVSAFTLSWREFELMMRDNNQNGEDERLFKICFMPITSLYDDTQISQVSYPHGVAIYLMKNGNKLLDDAMIIGSFQNNAGDYDTLCPPNCKKYVWPKVLTQILRMYQA